MLNYFLEINENGGSLKAPGYILFAALILICLFAVSKINSRHQAHKISTKQLSFCAICMALAFVLSFVKLFDAPMGGSITLMSTFFITLVGYLYGTYIGVITGVAYGLLQLIVGPYFVHPIQILVDYPLAFGALGLSGVFAQAKHGLIKGYLLGITGRLFFAVLSGVVFFASYAGDMNVFLYSFAYNFAYIGIEGVLTVLILLVPAVKKGLSQIKQISINA